LSLVASACVHFGGTPANDHLRPHITARIAKAALAMLKAP
jgi:hypothetical protein